MELFGLHLHMLLVCYPCLRPSCGEVHSFAGRPSPFVMPQTSQQQSTAYRSTAQGSAAQHSAAQHSAAQRNTAQQSTAWALTPAGGCRTKIKTRLETAYGEWVERIPAWIKWATQVLLEWASLRAMPHSILMCMCLCCCRTPWNPEDMQGVSTDL